MEQIGALIADSPVLQNLIANPMIAVAVVVVSFIMAKVLKLAGKVVKMILLLGGAYVIVNFVLSGVV